MREGGQRGAERDEGEKGEKFEINREEAERYESEERRI